MTKDNIILNTKMSASLWYEVLLPNLEKEGWYHEQMAKLKALRDKVDEFRESLKD